MPLIRCISHYRNGLDEWTAGKEENVGDEQAAFLLADSPGSFVLAADEAPSGSDNVTTTATGITAPDRRARGGRVR